MLLVSGSFTQAIFSERAVSIQPSADLPQHYSDTFWAHAQPSIPPGFISRLNVNDLVTLHIFLLKAPKNNNSFSAFNLYKKVSHPVGVFLLIYKYCSIIQKPIVWLLEKNGSYFFLLVCDINY